MKITKEGAPIPHGLSIIGGRKSRWHFWIALRYRRGAKLWRFRIRTYMWPCIICGCWLIEPFKNMCWADPSPPAPHAPPLPPQWRRK